PSTLLDISAQLEPDADHDGYGDQTQDKCYTDPSTQLACPRPTIIGVAQVGHKLTASPKGKPINSKWQWLRCKPSGAACVAIPRAIKTIYTLVAADRGHTI